MVQNAAALMHKDRKSPYFKEQVDTKIKMIEEFSVHDMNFAMNGENKI